LHRVKNANTRLVSLGPRFEATWLDEAYAHAKALDAPPMTTQGVRLVWWRGPEVGYHDLSVDRRNYAVVGRHTRCDVVLATDTAVGLRHLLVRATALKDGSTALHILDLQSTLGFHLDDDVERRALTAVGPLAIRVGRYALVALPSGVALPEARPATDVIDAPARSEYASVSGRTSVTALLPLPTLDDIARDRAVPGVARVTLRRGGAWASTDLPEAALDRGVLVGRAHRCDSRLRHVLSESISRVHLMVLREHGVVHAFDVASEQGVFAAGQRVRRVRLPDTGGTLRLAMGDPVYFEWHPRVSSPQARGL
jgi:hypothetical protein